MTLVYKGYVSRQELTDHCKESADRLGRELMREQEILDKGEKTMSDDQYETLVMSQAAITGHIRALRSVLEWAEKHKVDEREMFGIKQIQGNEGQGVLQRNVVS